MANNLTYAIYRKTPAFDRTAFARARGQGVIEQFDHLRINNNGNKVWLKWRGEQPAELVSGFLILVGTHAQAHQLLKDDSDEWTTPEI